MPEVLVRYFNLVQLVHALVQRLRVQPIRVIPKIGPLFHRQRREFVHERIDSLHGLPHPGPSFTRVNFAGPHKRRGE